MPVGLAAITLSREFLTIFGALALASLVPIVWAIVDVVRRPPWQFSTGRKIMWATTLGLGWLLLWPIALVSALVYLMVLRRRFPPATATPSPGAAPWQYHQYQSPLPPQQPVHPRDLPPAGWYRDPGGGPGERWWDGLGWSDRVR